jgi:hypothetical protein
MCKNLAVVEFMFKKGNTRPSEPTHAWHIYASQLRMFCPVSENIKVKR